MLTAKIAFSCKYKRYEESTVVKPTCGKENQENENFEKMTFHRSFEVVGEK